MFLIVLKRHAAKAWGATLRNILDNIYGALMGAKHNGVGRDEKWEIYLDDLFLGYKSINRISKKNVMNLL